VETKQHPAALAALVAAAGGLADVAAVDEQPLVKQGLATAATAATCSSSMGCNLAWVPSDKDERTFLGVGWDAASSWLLGTCSSFWCSESDAAPDRDRRVETISAANP